MGKHYMRNHAYTNILDGMEELDRVFEKVSGYFSLLAEPTRLKILHALCDGEKPVNTVVETVGSSQTNVSRHLNAMYRSGVLSRRKEANLVFYAIADEAWWNCAVWSACRWPAGWRTMPCPPARSTAS